MDKDIPRPATLDSLPYIRFPFRRGLDHFKNPNIVAPGNRGATTCRTNRWVGVGFSEARTLRFRAPKPVMPGKRL